MSIHDVGPQPHAFDIESATVENENYRTVVWTGAYLQVTLMSIPVGECDRPREAPADRPVPSP